MAARVRIIPITQPGTCAFAAKSIRSRAAVQKRVACIGKNVNMSLQKRGVMLAHIARHGIESQPIPAVPAAVARGTERLIRSVAEELNT